MVWKQKYWQILIPDWYKKHKILIIDSQMVLKKKDTKQTME
jgi:hypothetical protein